MTLCVCVRQRNGRFIIQDYPAGIEAPPCSTKYSPYPSADIDDMFASPACLLRNYNRPEPGLGPETETATGTGTATAVCPQFLEQLKMLSCRETTQTLRVLHNLISPGVSCADFEPRVWGWGEHYTSS